MSSHKLRDLSKHEAIWQHPDAERLLETDRRTVVVVESGASVEVITGLAAVAVTVIGIDGYRPIVMASVATLLLGIALVTQGGAIASRWRAMLRRFESTRFDRAELIGGIGTEVFGGVVGIVIAILALAGVVPHVMIPVATIVYGAALLLGGAAQPELAILGGKDDSRANAVEASGGIMVLVGIAAGVLGILALLDVGPIVELALIALLCVGGALTFAGGALAARLMGRLA
ncbi:MAG: hypothetical protein JO257_14325 [Deltaproteobacteria bacterium]|nr:hypothetical protein [Deltaproteobacteria bacterium]